MSHLKATVHGLDHTTLLYLIHRALSWALGCSSDGQTGPWPHRAYGPGAAAVVEGTLGLAPFKVPGPAVTCSVLLPTMPLVMCTDSLIPMGRKQRGQGLWPPSDARSPAPSHSPELGLVYKVLVEAGLREGNLLTSPFSFAWIGEERAASKEGAGTGAACVWAPETWFLRTGKGGAGGTGTERG